MLSGGACIISLTMRRGGVSGIKRLRELSNLCWLTPLQLNRLAIALTVSWIEKLAIIVDKKHAHAPESAFLLLSGVARIGCRNRKGDLTSVISLAPVMIPSFPPLVSGINYDFRCEAVTDCEIGTVAPETLIEITLGIASTDFTRMATNYFGRWDLVQLRCANFMSCMVEERITLVLLELCETFGVRDGRWGRLTVLTPHKNIAQLAGPSRPRVSLYIAKLKR
jgi:hypothetical protein